MKASKQVKRHTKQENEQKVVSARDNVRLDVHSFIVLRYG